jgi:flagellar basal-body rod protein FlgF
MQSSIYVGLSGQFALFKRLETVAHNVANTSTGGFRAEEVKFDSFFSKVPPNSTAFATTSATYLSRRAGPVERTDDPLNVAIQGDAWMMINVGGQQVYTRDGRMMMTATGELQTLNGDPVLDVGGAPLQLNPTGAAPQIAHDGSLFQDGQRVGAIGLFTIDESAKLTRAGTSGVIPDQPGQPALDFTVVGLHQGFVERSNVNPVQEMTRLIGIHRMFDAVTNSVNAANDTLQRAIQEIGPGNP